MRPPDACADLALSPSILDRLTTDLLAVGSTPGAMPTAHLLYLALTSRLLDDPVSVVVKAGSSSGKSWLVNHVRKFFPESACVVQTGSSAKTLIYGDESLVHRMIVIHEATGMGTEEAVGFLRSLLSEGRIDYDVVVKKVVKGVTSYGVERIVRDGPTGLITTTILIGLDAELETRLLSLAIPDTPEQTRAVLLAQGSRFAHSQAATPDYRPWIELQRWLEDEPVEVDVPFAEQVASMMSASEVRLRRDVIKFLTLVQAHALLHRASRELDDQGRIVATIEGDYGPVVALAGPILAATAGLSVKRETRETVEVVVGLIAAKPAPLSMYEQTAVSIEEIARGLGLHRRTAARRVADAVEQGLLGNLETRPRQAARIVLGELLPSGDVPVFPSVSELLAAEGVDVSACLQSLASEELNRRGH